MIHTILVLDPLRPRETSIVGEVAWSIGLTIRHACPSEFDLHASNVLVTRNGKEVFAHEWDAQLVDDDCIGFARAPEGIEWLAVAKWVAISFMVNVGAQLVLGIFAPKKPKQAGDGSSATYAFGGIGNTSGEGLAIPMVYGQHRVGGSIVGYYSELVSASVVRINVLVLLAGHEIEGWAGAQTNLTQDTEELSATLGYPTEEPLTGSGLDLLNLQINGQPAGGIGGIEAWTRRGRLHQSKLPNFASKVIEYTAGTLVTAPSVAVAASTPGQYVAGTEPSWSNVASFTMVDLAQHVAVRFAFNKGLYEIDTSNGGVDPSTVQLQIRYRKVDGGGTPSGDYFVLPATTITLASLSPVYFESLIDFASTYSSAPSLGNALTLDGVNDYASRANFEVPTQPFDDIQITVMGWIRLSASASNTGGGAAAQPSMFSHYNGSYGFKIALYDAVNDTTKCVVEVVMAGDAYGGGTTSQVFRTPPVAKTSIISGGQGVWTFIGFGWKGYWEGGTFAPKGKLTIYLGPNIALDVLVPTKLSAVGGFRPQWAATTQALVGYDGGSKFVNGRIDSLSVFKTYVNPSSVIKVANAKDAYGNPATGFNLSDPNLHALWKFDGNANDSSANSYNLTLNGGANTTGNGVIYKPETATLITEPDRYRIDVIRLDVSSESANAQDETTIDLVRFITDIEFQHPTRALLSLRITGSEAISGSLPKIACDVRGKKVEVWDGEDSQYPNLTRGWSANPAWIAMDAHTDADLGLGGSFTTKSIDLPAFKAWADYCDQRLNSGKPETTFLSASFLAGVVTITYDSPGPSHIAVGGEISIHDTASDWDTEPYKSLTVLTKSDTGAVVTITASWPAETSWAAAQADPVDPAPGGGKLGGREARCRFDGVFDVRDEPAPQAIASIFQAGRAFPVWLGARVTVAVKQAKNPVGIVGMANVVPGTFQVSYLSNRARPNSMEMDILDRDESYERTTVLREHDSLLDPANLEFVRSARVDGRGITRRSQALRDMDVVLETNALSARSVTFSIGADGLPFLPGDVILVAHDVVQWGTSGRVWDTASADTEIALDRDVTLTAGSTYQVTVRNSATDEIATVAIDASEIPGVGSTTIAAGTEITLATALAWTATRDDLYAFGVTGLQTREYEIESQSIDQDTLVRRVVARQYAGDAYDLDLLFEHEDEPNIIASTTLDPQGVPPLPLAVTVKENSIRTPDGAIDGGIVVTWTTLPESRSLLSHHALWLQEDALQAPFHVADVAGPIQLYRISGLAAGRGQVFRVYVQPVSTSGARVPVDASPSATTNIFGQSYRPAIPRELAVSLRGEEAVYSWDAATEVGVPFVEARIGGWVLGQRLFREQSSRQRSQPLPFWADAPTNSKGEGAPTINVASVLQNGIISELVPTTFTSSVIGASAALVKTAVEDDWTTGATLTDLAVDSTTFPLRAPMMEMSGVALTASYVSATFDLTYARRTYVQAFAVVEQVHPQSIDELPYESDSLEIQRWLAEGPSWLIGESECTFQIEWSYSETGTPGSNWRPFEPGVVYARSFRFRLSMTRPDATFNVRVFRLGVTVTHPPGTALDEVARPVSSVNFNGQQATGFRIENRTSNPGSPEVGRLILRTDLI